MRKYAAPIAAGDLKNMRVFGALDPGIFISMKEILGVNDEQYQGVAALPLTTHNTRCSIDAEKAPGRSSQDYVISSFNFCLCAHDKSKEGGKELKENHRIL